MERAGPPQVPGEESKVPAASTNPSMDTTIPNPRTARRIETVRPRAGRIQSWPKGRLCASGHRCPPNTRLSIYNGEDECALCAGFDQVVESEDIAEIMAEAPGPR